MRTTRKLALVAIGVVFIAACHDNPASLDETENEFTDEFTVYASDEARTRYLDILNSELASPQLLELNAQLNGQSVGERRSHIREGIEILSTMSSSSGACGTNPQFSWTDVSVAVLDPLFPGLPYEAVASGMTVTTQNANLRLYVYGEGGPEWSGAPHYDTSQVSAADADETTRSCTSLQLVHTDRFKFKPNDAGCWYVYGESTHYILSPAPAQQQTRQILKLGGPMPSGWGCPRYIGPPDGWR